MIQEFRVHFFPYFYIFFSSKIFHQQTTFSYTEVWFNDQNPVALEIEGRINFKLVFNGKGI